MADKRRLLAVFLLIAISFQTASAELTSDQERRIRGAMPQAARVAPKRPRKVLIWNTPYMEKSPHKGYTIPQSACAMRLLGETTGAFEPVVSDDQTLLLPAKLAAFDAVVMNNSCQAWTRPTEASLPKFKRLGYGDDPEAIEQVLRKSLLDWVRSGRGVMAFHYAIGANRDWPAFRELLGARMNGHPWNEEVGVWVEEPGHPLVAAFEGASGFRIADEIFQFADPYDRSQVRVLLSLDTETTDMTVPWLHRKDGDFALAWVKSYGEGRVFYSALGHRTELWWNPQILAFYLDAIQFACGDLECEMRPRE